MFLYRKVAILNVSKDRFDHSSVYLGEMKLTPSAFLRRLKYTCSSERFLEISTTNEKLPCKSHINKRNTFFMVTLRYKNIKAPFTVGHKGA